MNVTLYKYAANPIIVDKTSYLQSAYSVSGEVPESNQDMERPTLYFAFSAEPEYNYAYVAEYHRYYYITRKTWMSGNVWSFEMQVDELYTYRALISGLSGIFDYSTYGDGTKFDPRLNYNVPPVRSTVALDTSNGGDSSIGTPIICLRHFTSDYDNTLLGQTNVQAPIAAEYMTTAAYQAFCVLYEQLVRNNESMAVAIGASIIDVSVIYYSNIFDSSSTIRQSLSFSSPAIWKLNSYADYYMDLTTAAGITQALIGVYTASPYNGTNIPLGKQFDFNITNNYYWMRTAKRTVYLPYIGNVEVDLDKIGLGNSSSCTLRVGVKHEAMENTYVITLSRVSPNTSFYTQRQIVNVSTTMPLFLDTSFENKTKTEQIKMFNLISQGVAIGGSAAAYGMLFPGTASHFINNIFTTELELDNLKVSDALSTKAIGVIGGSPDLVTSLTIPYMEVLAAEPAQGYQQYWNRFGKPDGAFRLISGYSGYVQLGQFEMIYDPNATIGEMTRLEAQLRQGVIL